MALIWRLMVIAFAFLVASLAAGIVLTVAVLFPAWSNFVAGNPDDGMMALVLTFGVIFVSGFALLPALIAIAIAEGLNIRSALYYAFAGAVVGFVIYVSLGGVDFAALGVNGATRRESEIMIGAGIVAGLVYWLFAGRHAGQWRAQMRRSVSLPPQRPGA